jgi:hypothetical protein
MISADGSSVNLQVLNDPLGGDPCPGVAKALYAWIRKSPADPCEFGVIPEGQNLAMTIA